MKTIAFNCAKSVSRSISIPGGMIKPVVSLFAISDITETTFRISAVIDPYPSGTVKLEYGKTEAMGSEIALGEVIGHTLFDQVVTPDPLILQPGDAFYCRIMVTNNAGSTPSAVQQGGLLNEFALVTDSEDGTKEFILTDAEDGTPEFITINLEDR